MEKYYSINDMAKFTGLTTRTLRNYLKMNVLSGEKIDGVWQFTEEELEAFLSDPTVKPSIQAKQNALVYDFMLDRKKTKNEMCTVLDFCVGSKEESVELSKFFCEEVNKADKRVQFSFEKAGDNARVVLKGNEEDVMEILREYYRG